MAKDLEKELNQFLNGVEEQVDKLVSEGGVPTPDDKLDDSKVGSEDIIDDEKLEDDEIPEDDKKDDIKDDKSDDDDELFDEDTSKKQSKNKKDPANKKFGDMNRENKTLRSEIDVARLTKVDIDKKFAALAKDSGFEGIETAEDYYNSLTESKALSEYTKTKDPKLLVDATVARMGTKKDSNAKAKEYGEERFQSEMATQMTELNDLYGTKVKTSDDIANLPNARKIIERLRRKDTLAEAYLVVNKDLVLENARNSSRQKAINDSKGYAHTKRGTSAGSLGSSKLSSEEITESLPYFKAMFSNESHTDLIKRMQKAKSEGAL